MIRLPEEYLKTEQNDYTSIYFNYDEAMEVYEEIREIEVSEGLQF